MNDLNKEYGYFIKEYELRSLDTDFNSVLRPNAVQELLQDIAGRHADELGIGIKDLKKENLTWVLVSTETKLYGKVEYMGKLQVKTWPLKSKGVKFQREYVIYNGDNQVVAKSSSIWVLIDLSSRKLAVKKDAYAKIESYIEEKCFEEKYIKVPVLDNDSNYVDITVKSSDIDINKHVNNTKYLSYVADSIDLEENEYIKSYKIDYIKEVKFHEAIRLYYKKEENSFIAKGIISENEVAFCALIEVGDINEEIF